MVLLALLTACGSPPEDTAAPAPDARGDGYAAFVMSTLVFTGPEEDGSMWGFNLDRVVTEAGDTTGCGRVDAIDPEGRPGIDNAFAGLMPVIETTEAAALPALAQDAVNNGELLLVVELEGLDDYENDDVVTLAISPAVGTPRLGTNGTLLDGQTFDRDPDLPRAVYENAAVVDGRVEADGLTLALALQVLDAALSFQIPQGAIRIDLAPDGSYAAGHFGGGFSTPYLLEALDGTGVDDGLVELLHSLLPALADLETEEGRCELLSVDLQFTAVPAFFYEE